MSGDRILLERADPAMRRAVETAAGAALPWASEGAEGAASATIWFCPGLPPAAPRALPALRWIHSGWAGIDAWVDRDEWRDGIVLTRTVGDMPQRIAEYVAGYLLADALGVRDAIRQMEERSWRRWTPGSLVGCSLLVVGYGAIGARVAAMARSLGMTTRGIRRGPLDPEDPSRGVEEAAALDALLPASDVVVNVLPLTPSTRSFWTAERFARMRADSVFVNVSRGATVDEEALAAAVVAGRPARAILDVFREEPLPPDHPLRGIPGVWITPHISGIGTMEALAGAFAENWERWQRGLPLRHRVDRARGY